MSYPFRNLVFEGGGVKGLAYVGAMEVLESEGIGEKVRRVGGTSAGSINAVLFAAGYSACFILFSSVSPSSTATNVDCMRVAT